MFKWAFSGFSAYGEHFVFTIKASNKQTAMEKGIAKVQQKFNCGTNNFECKLLNY